MKAGKEVEDNPGGDKTVSVVRWQTPDLSAGPSGVSLPLLTCYQILCNETFIFGISAML
ncbi:hypothetical protein J6590_090758, partial [Homalodisca vitripennis]